jgi:hypothetical protein
MKPRITRPSPALVVAVVALVFAMAGSGYAAIQSLPKKSVGTKQLKANAVTGAKVKNQTLTGKDIKLKTLGAVPLANTANVANLANTVVQPVLHVVGAPGEPPFLKGATPVPAEGPISLGAPSFFKDASGVVHLEGAVKSGSEPIVFALPPGFRPAAGRFQVFEAQEVIVIGALVSGGQDVSGFVIVPGGESILNGITFRAEG